MGLVRSFGASPPPAREVARVTERVVRNSRLIATEGQLVPLSQAEELDLPHEVVTASTAKVRTAAVAEPARESRAPAPEPERSGNSTVCPTCSAIGNDPCLTASGNEAAKRHADRPE